MRIIVDGRPLVTTNAGIAMFLRGALTALAKKHSEDTFLVALPREMDETVDRKIFPDNVTFKVRTNSLLCKMPNLIWLNAVFPLMVRSFRADIFFSALPCIPFFLPRKTRKIIVVHDVVNIEYEDTMQWTNKLSNWMFFNRSVKKADVLWTNSRYTKEKVEKYFPERRCKNIFSGCAINRSVYKRLNLSPEEVDALKAKYSIDGDYILFVGSLEPRKNLGFLLSMMPKIVELGIKLVVVGGKKWKSSSLRSIVEAEGFPKESVIFCQFVPDEDLAKLYNTAKCFVSTSLNEGFGMPQLEAMFCGCPVVTAHNSAMIEVAEGKTGAYTVKGYDQEDWIRTIEEAISAGKHPKDEDLVEYDWERVVEGLRLREYR